MAPRPPRPTGKPLACRPSNAARPPQQVCQGADPAPFFVSATRAGLWLRAYPFCSRLRLENEIERRLGGAPEAREAAAFHHDVAQPRLACLRAERQPDLL